MNSSTLRLGCALGALVLTLWIPAQAAAEPGEGLKTESLVLSPSLTVTGAYDTNVFRLEPEESPNGERLVSPLLTVTPAFSLRTRDSVDLDFSLNGSLNYDEYFAPQFPQVDAQGGFSGSGGTALTLNPDGAVSFNVHDDIEYKAQPPNMPSGRRMGRLYNKAGAILGFHPGDDVLRLDAGYDFEFYRYYEDERLLDLDKNQHSFTLDGSYKFLPKTAFVARGNWKIINYESPNRRGAIPNIDSTPLRIMGGMSGLITRRFSVRLLGGYGHGMYDREDDFQSFIGDFQLAYRLSPGKSKNKDAVFVRYERGFEDSTVTNFYAFHRGTVGYQQGILDRRLEFDIKASVHREDYSRILADQAADPGGVATFPGDLKDTRFLGNVGLTANATKWLSFTGRYQYDQNITNTNYEYTGASFDPTRQYVRHYFSLSAKAKY
jgi:hypothetical protein